MKRRRKPKASSIRGQILELADDIGDNPESALVTLGVIAAFGVGGFFIVRALRKRREEKEKKPPAGGGGGGTPPSILPTQPVSTLPTIGFIYAIPEHRTQVNLRNTPSTTGGIYKTVDGLFVLGACKSTAKDATGEFWGSFDVEGRRVWVRGDLIGPYFTVERP